MNSGLTSHYCKTLNICGIKFLRFNENVKMANLNFGGYDTIVQYSKENMV